MKVVVVGFFFLFFFLIFCFKHASPENQQDDSRSRGNKYDDHCVILNNWIAA